MLDIMNIKAAVGGHYAAVVIVFRVDCHYFPTTNSPPSLFLVMYEDYRRCRHCYAALTVVLRHLEGWLEPFTARSDCGGYVRSWCKYEAVGMILG